MSSRRFREHQLLEPLEDRKLFAGGSIDPLFGAGSVIAVGFAAGSSVMNDLVVYPDGSILTGGYAVPLVNNQPANAPQMALARYLLDGQLDQSFGLGGQSYGTPRGLKNALDLAMLSDGSFVVIGSSVSGYSTRANLLVKFTPGGKVDVTFGSNGRVNLPISGAALHVAPGDSILVAGQQDRNGALVRYTSAGRIDVAFGQAGIFSTDTVFNPDIDANFVLDSIALDSDGRIYAAGSYRDTPVNSQEADLDVRALRINSLGEADPSFGGTGGFLSVRNDVLTGRGSFDADDATFGTITIDANDQPVIVASAADGEEAFATRLLSTGQPDPVFGDDGVTELRVRPARYPISSSLQTQSDGKVLFAGVAERSGRNVFAVERLDATGEPDATYGDAGVAAVPYRKLSGEARASALAPDGTLVLGGIVGSVETGGANDSRRFALTRLFPEEGPSGQLIPKTLRSSQAGFLFDIWWRDDDALNPLTIDGGDLRLFGADGIARRAKLTSQSVSIDGKIVFARYRLPATDGVSFTRADNGLYEVKVLSNQVADTTGAFASKRTLGNVRIRIA